MYLFLVVQRVYGNRTAGRYYTAKCHLVMQFKSVGLRKRRNPRRLHESAIAQSAAQSASDSPDVMLCECNEFFFILFTSAAGSRPSIFTFNYLDSHGT